MTQSEVRQMFVRNNPGIRINGYGGYWYRCAHCGKWCGRPGRERAQIPDDMKMEVDHIQSWKNGGSDEMWNLQPLCRPCNRSKGKNSNLQDNIRIAGNLITHPMDTAASMIRKEVRNSSILSALGLNKRK